jgi:hypothetical protein
MSRNKEIMNRRCAIYTRKSSEEGLEQSFNSLDAQREACESFIGSQRHEGWRAMPTRYDDGGYSGGTMERPALKRLLDEKSLPNRVPNRIQNQDMISTAFIDHQKHATIFLRLSSRCAPTRSLY